MGDDLLALCPETRVNPEGIRRYSMEGIGDQSGRFIMTFPKRGHEFAAPVTVVTAAPATYADDATGNAPECL
jgi:DNA-binding winged helix-turn-helix (wHTH) protein